MSSAPSIPPPLAAALAERGYETLTAVQEAILAPDVAGRDALVSARTGSGKTVAFGLAMAPELLSGQDGPGRAEAPLALVVAPTRELALQVRRELEWLYAPAGVVLASCVGGMDPRAERRALQQGAHLVVGTPGRLRDHIERRALDLTGLRTIVLDEADEMLDLGFREDLEHILSAAPEDRRTLLFSATVPRGISALAKRFQRDAVRISPADERQAHADIEYRAFAVPASEREKAVYNLLRFHDAESALVFCSTRAAAAHLAARLSNRGFPVVALSGELNQAERTRALQAMRDGRARVCVATDVAARGIDLPGLELVIHADLPASSETLLHRSGRTGRAGRKGVCALVVPERARRKAERLLAGAGVEAAWAAPPGPAEIRGRDDARVLEDAGLADPPAEDEAAMVAALLDRHGAERVAAAFLRRLRAGMAAPEELAEAAGRAAPRQAREAFGPGVWFELSVGRAQRAEPRWLLPLILGAGELERKDVGAIRVGETTTHVEIAAARADAFLAAAGPDRTLEKGVTVRRSDSPPPPAARRAGPARSGRGRPPGAPGKPSRKRR